MFEAVRVSRSEARRCHILVTLSQPSVSMEQWNRFLRNAIRPRSTDSGVVALRDSRRCIHALFAFRIARMLGCEATLQVTEITALRLPGTVLVTSLMRFADDLAVELGLPSIAIDMQSSETWSQDRRAMERSGFTIHRVMMRGSASRRKAMPVPG